MHETQKVPKTAFVRAREISAAMGVTTNRIYQLLAAGDLALPVLRLGRSILVPRDAWDAWLEAQNERPVEVEKGDK